MIICQIYAFIGLAFSYMLCSPLLHLLFVLIYCLANWFINPKDTLLTSVLTCLYLMLYGHVPWSTGGYILISHPVVLLVVGCLIAQVIIKNDLHLVISTQLMQSVNPSSELSLVILMMAVSGFLSMWVSNTSVVAMLIPVVINLGSSLNLTTDKMLLAIAYGATIGGMLTPIGTPANLVAIDYASRYFGIEIDFTTWVLWALPIVTCLCVTLCCYFWQVCQRSTLNIHHQSYCAEKPQRHVMVLLLVCVLLWALQYAPYGGWSQLLGLRIQEEYIGMLILFFISFIKYGDKPAMTVSDTLYLPFASIAMVIAGIYMAEGLMHYNVVDIVIGELLEGQLLQSYQTLTVFGLLMSLLTELCSNTAITSLGLPLSTLMMKLSKIDILPCIFLITFSANSAFMLPTATPPNALILGTGKLSSKQMLFVGLLISISSLIFLVLMLNYI